MDDKDHRKMQLRLGFPLFIHESGTVHGSKGFVFEFVKRGDLSFNDEAKKRFVSILNNESDAELKLKNVLFSFRDREILINAVGENVEKRSTPIAITTGFDSISEQYYSTAWRIPVSAYKPTVEYLRKYIAKTLNRSLINFKDNGY